jgi:ABC-type multidrug transport system fused ATPase/permease subunit
LWIALFNEKSEMYKMSGIQINSEWINEINGIQSNDASEDESHEEQQELNNQNDDSDHFSEVDETDLHVGNTDTLFDEIADDSHLIGDNLNLFFCIAIFSLILLLWYLIYQYCVEVS